MRAIIYVRQSVKNEESISLELQETACREHATSHGYEVTEVIKDPGISGLQFAKRPGIRRALDLVEASEADVVIVWRWSRLSRRRSDQAVILDRIEKAGGQVESATEPIDVTTAGGRFSREVMLAVASFESDTKSEQWKEAHARRIKNGLPAGGAVRFGYEAGAKGAPARPHPINGPALRQAYLDYINGAGFMKIVKRMADDGVLTGRGKQITTHSLIAVMDAGFAAGYLVRRVDEKTMVHGEMKTIKVPVFDRRGIHPPLINEDEWQAYRRARAARSIAHPKLRTAKWYLASIVRCGLCGGPMIVNSYSREKSQALCSRYKSQRTCRGIWIYREFLEHKIAMWLGGRIDELAQHAYDGSDRDKERHKITMKIGNITQERVEIEQSLGKLATGWSTGLLDDTGYQAARTSQQAARAALDEVLGELHARLDALLPLDADVYDRLLAATEDMDSGEHNTLLKRVIDRVVVSPDHVTVFPVAGELTVYARH